MGQNKKGYLFILPSLLGVIVFLVLPFADVIRRSFLSPSQRQWVGVSNYLLVMENDAFKIALKNTFCFLLICIPMLVLLAVLFSFCIENFFRNKYIIKGLFLIPMAMPISTIVLFCKIVFHEKGFLNFVWEMLHLSANDWINSSYAFIILVIIYIWKNIGYSVILCCTAWENLDIHLFDSASLDGANKLQQFIFIVIPNLLTSLFVITVLAVINAFKVFRESYLIAGSYPKQNIYMLQNVFNNWFRDLSIDKMSAGAVLSASVLVVFILLLGRAWRKKAQS